MSKSVTRKNNKGLLLIALWCLVLLNTGNSFAQKQSKKDLENKKKELQKEIEYTNQLLAETKKNKKLS